MKKTLLSTLVVLCAGFGVANAAIDITTANVEQCQGDTMLFQLPVDVTVYQDIQNYPDANPGMRMLRFQPEYLVTARDFTRGDVTKGTATLPANAKVVGLGLDGYDNGSDNTRYGIFLTSVAWCRNVPATKMSLDYLDLFDGYNVHQPVGDLFTDMENYKGYYNEPGVTCVFDPACSAENPMTIVDIPFNNPEVQSENPEAPFPPFWYKGENIYLTLWISNYSDTHLKYCYMAYDDAEAEMASLMRSGNFCFNSNTVEDVEEVLGSPLMYDLPAHRLPAFRTPYYTNDLRLFFTDQPADVELQDAQGQAVAPAEDGNFYSLDHTQTYTLVVDGIATSEITFDNIYTDVEAVISKDYTAVDEISASKAVAGVRYYNLAGQEMSEASGICIAVTTYTDGSTSAIKVVK